MGLTEIYQSTMFWLHDPKNPWIDPRFLLMLAVLAIVFAGIALRWETILARKSGRKTWQCIALQRLRERTRPGRSRRDARRPAHVVHPRASRRLYH